MRHFGERQTWFEKHLPIEWMEILLSYELDTARAFSGMGKHINLVCKRRGIPVIADWDRGGEGGDWSPTVAPQVPANYTRVVEEWSKGTPHCNSSVFVLDVETTFLATL